jgi:hypothetical protein
MVYCLQALGYATLDVVKDVATNQLIYHFPLDEVWGAVEKILNKDTDDLTFKITGLLEADATWQMNLKHLSMMRRNACSA